MAYKKPAGSGQGAGSSARHATKPAAHKRGVKLVSGASGKGVTAKSGRLVLKPAASGRYKVGTKMRKAGGSSPTVRPTALVQGKLAGGSPPRVPIIVDATVVRRKQVTDAAIEATSKRSSPNVKDVATGDVRAYLEALVAELDTALLPGVARRILAGATRVSPKELAKRMLAVAPAPAPENKMADQVGPEFYDTAGVSVVLGEPGGEPISKQAVEHRRKRQTILALQTSDGRWIYPTWQFRDHEVIPGLAEVLEVFDDHPRWSVGTWLTTPLRDLDGRNAVQWISEGCDQERLIRVARRTASRWAA